MRRRTRKTSTKPFEEQPYNITTYIPTGNIQWMFEDEYVLYNQVKTFTYLVYRTSGHEISY